MTSKKEPSLVSSSAEGGSTAAREEPPPSYYTPPSQYTVGNKPVSQPFVNIEQLKAHLALLRAFKNLRTAVEEDAGSRLPEQIRTVKDEQSASVRWGYVVSLAVER